MRCNYDAPHIFFVSPCTKCHDDHVGETLICDLTVISNVDANDYTHEPKFSCY